MKIIQALLFLVCVLSSALSHTMNSEKKEFYNKLFVGKPNQQILYVQESTLDNYLPPGNAKIGVLSRYNDDTQYHNYIVTKTKKLPIDTVTIAIDRKTKQYRIIDIRSIEKRIQQKTEQKLLQLAQQHEKLTKQYFLLAFWIGALMDNQKYFKDIYKNSFVKVLLMRSLKKLTTLYE